MLGWVDAFAGRQRGPGHEDHREQKSQLPTGTPQGLVCPSASLQLGLGISSLNSSSSSSCIPAGASGLLSQELLLAGTRETLGSSGDISPALLGGVLWVSSLHLAFFSPFWKETAGLWQT